MLQQTTRLTNHGEDVGNVRGALVAVAHVLLIVSDECHCQAEVRAEGVQEYGTARIRSLRKGNACQLD